MPRCIICDLCSDTQSTKIKITWSDHEQGFLCSTCRGEIYEARVLSENKKFFSEDDLEFLEFLEDTGVDEIEDFIDRGLQREVSDSDT